MTDAVETSASNDSQWPLAIGWMSLMIASYSFLNGLPLIHNWHSISIMSFITPTLALLLVAGAILLLRRRCLARRLHLGYAWLMLAWMAWSCVVMVFSWGIHPLKNHEDSYSLTFLNSYYFLFLNLAYMFSQALYPIFLIIWFSRRTIKEQMAGWRQRQVIDVSDSA